jgi:hypothetical protein
MVYSRAERVVIVEHYFASKSSAVAHEACHNANPGKYRIKQQYADR